MTADELAAIITIDQIEDAARLLLGAGSHAWAAAGAGQEVTTARNTIALNSLALIPRLGRDVSRIDTTTRVAGIEMEMPVFMAPVGALGIYDVDDALASARAAAAASMSIFCSILTTSSWEEVAATAPGRHIFQLYVLGDRQWLSDLMSDVGRMGFGGFCVTMDSAVIGRRDRSLVDGFIWKTPPEGTVNLERRGWDASWRSRFSWGDLAWLCGQTDLPVFAKGIMHPDDARTAVECGASGIYVSNHGGRMIDHGISTIEVLGEIVESVDVDVVVDSGFTRGAEICKAVALGAKAVGLGRLQCWALAVGGSDGVCRVIQILAEEIAVTMANIGAAALDEINLDHVRWSIPTIPTP